MTSPQPKPGMIDIRKMDPIAGYKAIMGYVFMILLVAWLVEPDVIRWQILLLPIFMFMVLSAVQKQMSSMIQQEIENMHQVHLILAAAIDTQSNSINSLNQQVVLLEMARDGRLLP